MKDSVEELQKCLGRTRQIKISVTGRKSGATITLPVWFVLEEDKLYLLPVYGSETQWFKNLKKNRILGISTGGLEAHFKPVLMHDPKAVKAVVEKFRAKYGAADVKKYYRKFDVAVRIGLSHPASAAA
ncbi:MAG TPA: nitroreductase/quinone reductase family protein [Terriglobales bacterium]|nr:nitroreductase/quinone reductase family protein [Terriglobales bacterium]